MNNINLQITPKTKVGELLDQYPQLEDLLIEMVPTFAKLKNPVLRRTIARVTSLQQAALVGGIAIDELINKLRNQVGQENMDHSHPTQIENTENPEWFSADRISISFDAREIIAAGGHPLSEVIAGANKVQNGQIYELITPFLPAPLIDKVKAMGFRSWSKQAGTVFYTYFIKDQSL